MSEILEKYNQWPSNTKDLTGAEKILMRIASSVDGHSDLSESWADITNARKAEILEYWKRVITQEFTSTLKEAMKEHGYKL